MGYLVSYKCIADSYDYGKKGAVNKIFFPGDYSEELARSYAPSNWVVDFIQEMESLPPLIKEEE